MGAYNLSQYDDYIIDEASIYNENPDYSNIYRSKEFNEVMNYFDITDNKTRTYLLSIEEADQNLVIQALASKLYQHIVSRVDDIDFGTIPNSRGDITKIENYEQLRNCINVMGEILRNYKQPTDAIDVIDIALQNIIDRQELFTRAYKLNVELPIVMYNTMTLAVVSSVSYMIASCIEFIKLPDGKGFNIALDKSAKIRTKDHVLFKQLNNFNSSCSKGDFDKCMSFVINHNLTSKHEAADMLDLAKAVKGVVGGVKDFAATHPKISAAIIAGSIAVGVLGSLVGIIYATRKLIFYFYYTRTRFSEYLDAQSAILMMNAYNVENDLTVDEKARKKISERQTKIAEFFKKLSNKIKVNDKVGANKASKDEDKDKKEKFKIDDIDSAPGGLF